MTLDPAYVLEHVERALAEHEHGDACEDCRPDAPPDPRPDVGQ